MFRLAWRLWEKACMTPDTISSSWLSAMSPARMTYSPRRLTRKPARAPSSRRMVMSFSARSAFSPYSSGGAASLPGLGADIVGGLAGDEDGPQLGVRLADARQQFQPGHTGKPQVGHHHVDRPMLEFEQGFFRRGDDGDVVRAAGQFQARPQHACDLPP